MQKLYTVDELASELSVSSKTIRRALSEGIIGHYRFGSLIKFSEAHVSEYLDRIECRPV